METVTISLPEPLREWVESRVREGDYASVGDYLHDLVRRDRERAALPQLSLEDVQLLLAEGRASGISTKSFEDIIAEGDRMRKARGRGRE
jgi:antitoxin ParD1/3/4